MQAFGRLHVIVDVVGGRSAIDLVDAAVAGGASVVQLRAKQLSDGELYKLACQVVERCRETGALCIIDDRVDVAIGSGADGVHVGEQDLPVDVVRRIARSDMIVGATARDVRTARDRASRGASYIGAGPVYATSSKSGLPDPIGYAAIAEINDAVDVPVIAIGGITAEDARQLVPDSCYGVAVIGAVANAIDPKTATAELVDAVRIDAVRTDRLQHR